MSLANFQEHFSNTYEDIFQKVLVSKAIMNTRFEPTLRYGESLERFTYDIDNVEVRSVTRGAASTIDTISDNTEQIVVNLEKETVFHLSDGEITQAGPLNPGAVIGGKIAHKLAQHLDGRCFAEVRNARNSFDAGDLTGAFTSTGVGISLDSTTVPQMASRMPAKIMQKENVDTNTNGVLVVDAQAGSDITQYLLGKNIDLAGSTFRNGYTGPVHNAEMYVSENLTGEYTLTLTGVPSADETIVVAGVTATAKAVPSAAGEFDIAGTAAAQATIIGNMLNASATGQDSATGYFEFSEADRKALNNLDISAEVDGAVVSILGRGRFSFEETLSNATETGALNAYYGKRGAIDLVVQDMQEVDMRKTADRRGYNVFSSYLAGIKTFEDGAKQFMNVKLAI